MGSSLSAFNAWKSIMGTTGSATAASEEDVSTKPPLGASLPKKSKLFSSLLSALSFSGAVSLASSETFSKGASVGGCVVRLFNPKPAITRFTVVPAVGSGVGIIVVGPYVGISVGLVVGKSVGINVGPCVGISVGLDVGVDVGGSVIISTSCASGLTGAPVGGLVSILEITVGGELDGANVGNSDGELVGGRVLQNHSIPGLPI